MTTSPTTPPRPRPSEPPFGQAESGRDAGAGLPSWLSGLVRMGAQPWKGMYTLGIMLIILGVLILAWPGATLLVMAILFGCYLVVTGVMGMVEGFSDRHESTGMRVAYVIMGVLGVVLGLWCLRRVDVTVLILAFLLSVFWIMRGIVDLSAAMSVSGPGSGWLAFAGIMSVIAGVLVLFWPGITLAVLITFAGAWLLIYGAMLIYGGYRLHKLAPR